MNYHSFILPLKNVQSTSHGAFVAYSVPLMMVPGHSPPGPVITGLP